MYGFRVLRQESPKTPAKLITEETSEKGYTASEQRLPKQEHRYAQSHYSCLQLPVSNWQGLP